MWRKNRSPCPTPFFSFLGLWKGNLLPWHVILTFLLMADLLSALIPQEPIWIEISPVPGEKEWERGPGFKDPRCLFGKHILVRRTIYRNHNSLFLNFQLFKLSQELLQRRNRRPRRWWTFSTSIRMISRWKYFDCDCACACELISFIFCELLQATNFSSGLPCDPQFWQPCDSPKPLFSRSRLTHYLSLQLYLCNKCAY